MKETSLSLLDIDRLADILSLTTKLNPTINVSVLRSRQMKMFEFDNYRCFGIYEKEQLVGVSSGWLTVKLYSGKQLEIDNVIINPSTQSKGIGTKFMKLIDNWAKENGCKTIELNTYVQNNRSHKFYFNQGFTILGFHFQKQIK